MKVSKSKILFVLFMIVGIMSYSDAAVVVHYTFDETTGTTAGDSAAFGDPAYNGALTNNGFSFDTQSVAGKYGGALNFLGSPSDNYILVDSADYLNLPGDLGFGNNFTVSMWVKTSNWTQLGVLFAYGKNDLRFTIGFGSANGVPEIEVYSKDLDGANPDILIREQLPLPGIDTSIWHHIAVAVTDLGAGADPLIYVDGLSAGGTATDMAYTTDLGMRLGRREYSSKRYYTGAMDDFVIFNTTLNAQQINSIYNSATAIPEPTTITLLGLSGLMLIRRKK